MCLKPLSSADVQKLTSEMYLMKAMVNEPGKEPLREGRVVRIKMKRNSGERQEYKVRWGIKGEWN